MKICRAQALAMVAAIFTVLVAAGTLTAQQAVVDPTPATLSAATDSQQAPPSPQSDSAAPVHDPQTQDVLAFTGRVKRDKGQIVLNDPVTKISYLFDDQLRAKQFLGRRVKVTGKLELSSNRIRIESIEAIP
ncbi:MAG TPA: DUF5818 domain-containing protein [Candidatus Solibacter sp.]|nr:DUF5818 domain-containing protein [Candidatus Solibacter sp.]